MKVFLWIVFPLVLIALLVIGGVLYLKKFRKPVPTNPDPAPPAPEKKPAAKKADDLGKQAADLVKEGAGAFDALKKSGALQAIESIWEK